MIPARALRPALPRSGSGYPYAPGPVGSGRSELLSVVVVHHRGAEDLVACLRSIFEADFQRDVEVVVVDNGSADGGGGRASSLDPRVRIVRLPDNRGFAEAASAGIAASEGERVVLLNPDATVASSCLSVLWTATDDVDIATARVLLRDDPDRLDNCGHRLYPDGLNWCRGRGEAAAGAFEEAEDVLLFSGAAVAFRRDALVRVGAFDESYFGYGEDADLGLRAARLGLRCRYVPEAVVRHRVGGTFGAASFLKVFLVERNRARVAVTHLPRRDLLLSPLWTLGRHVALGWAAVRSRGPVAGGGAWTLPAAVVAGHLAALVDLPGCLARRRAMATMVADRGGLSDADWAAALRAHRIGLRELAASGPRS